MNKLKIATRLTLLIGSALAGIVLLVAVFLYSERSLLMQERQLGLQQAVETAHGVVAHFHDLAVKGTMPGEEAKQAAMAAIKALRYSGAEYFSSRIFNKRCSCIRSARRLTAQTCLDSRTPAESCFLWKWSSWPKPAARVL